MLACYQLTNGIKFESEEERSICRALSRMIHHHTDPVMTMLKGQDMPGVSRQALFMTVRYVASRTLEFGKPYEMITRNELAAHCGFSVRTAQRTFNWLTEREYLHKMVRKDDGNECYYGLNLRKVYTELRPIIDTMNIKTLAYQDMDALHNGVNLSVFDTLCKYLSSFANLVVLGVGSLLSKAKEVRKKIMGEVGNLLSMVTKAKDRAKAVSRAKSAKKAEEPLIGTNGKANGRVGLEIWYTAMEDMEYEGIVRDMTGKRRGLMGHFISELAAAGFDEEGIRESLQRIVAKWRWIPYARRTLHITNNNGKTYKTQIPANPDFGFFYIHREQVTPILRDVMSVDRPSDLQR